MNCGLCGKERKTLQKHHIVPKSQGGSDDPENLISICVNCHEDIHQGPFGGSEKGTRLSASPESLAKRSASMKAKWQDPEYRAKRHEGAVRGWQDPERRKLISNKRKEWIKNNPEKYAEANRKISIAKKVRTV